MLKVHPSVFAVGDEYQIMARVEVPSLFWVKIGNQTYYDDANGVLRSSSLVHRVHVPQAVLDAAGEYTVCEREIIDRKPYFPETKETVETTYTFRPVTGGTVRAYHIADAHNRVDQPLAAAAAFGDVDFLILNGDIPDHSGTVGNFDTIYEIVGRLGKGNIPTVCSRGNHDFRGICAELIGDYIPTREGTTYYTFRLGEIWGLVLDCGEDKEDDHEEYGGTVCCHAFRQRQTDYIRQVIANAAQEYAAEGVKHRVVVVHQPFTFVHRLRDPFSIEHELFQKWADLLRENVAPDVMICGHTHVLELEYPGCERDAMGHPCPIVVGSNPEPHRYWGAGYTFAPDGIRVQFTCSDGTCCDEVSL